MSCSASSLAPVRDLTKIFVLPSLVVRIILNSAASLSNKESLFSLSVKFKNQSYQKFQFLTNYFVFSFNLMEKLKSDYWKINTLPFYNEYHFSHIENNSINDVKVAMV